jgi:hypothetical protein
MTPEAALHPRHRPGNHLDPRDPVRRRRAAGREPCDRAQADLSGQWLGGARSEEIWQATLACGRVAMKGVNPSDIAAIGITNQRETTVLWDRKTGGRCTTPSSGRTVARRNAVAS